MKTNKFLKFFSPKDREFIPLFEEGSNIMVECATELLKMMEMSLCNDSPVQWEKGQQLIADKIKTLELKGDAVIHKIQDHLNTSFITPFDREDIHQLASKIDDVIDYMNNVAQRFMMYHPDKITSDFVLLAKIIHESSILIQKSIKCLNKADDLKTEIQSSCALINELEKTADDIYHSGTSKLFVSASEITPDKGLQLNSVELIKLIRLIETLEKTTDATEDVSDVIQTILVKII